MLSLDLKCLEGNANEVVKFQSDNVKWETELLDMNTNVDGVTRSQAEKFDGITVCGPNLDCSNIKHYKDGAQYWSTVKPSVSEMHGGDSEINNIDLEGSVKFLRGLFKLEKAPNKECALDCGAGIGRVTKNLLKLHFKHVDLVEQNNAFLEKAIESIGNKGKNKKKYKFICCGLQNFTPEPGTYDIIWCQWVLGQLMDIHLIEFLKRCGVGLKTNGMIVVKENITSSGKVERDEIDSSVTRPNSHFHYIFRKANLDVIRETPQRQFPKELYTVQMFALKPNSK